MQGALQTWSQIFDLAVKKSNASILDDQRSDSSVVKPAHGSTDLCIPFSIYVDFASASGLHLHVAEAWKKMRDEGFEFDSHNWNHLVVAVVRGGQPERAFEIVEKIFIPRQQSLGFRSRNNPANPILCDSPLYTADPRERMPRHPVHKGARRAHEVAVNERQLHFRPDLRASDVQDPAHALRVLHQVSSVGAWRLHDFVLDLLVDVLHDLESGLEIKSVQLRESLGSDDPVERADQKNSY